MINVHADESSAARNVSKGFKMAGILLWLMGVPLVVIVLLYLIF